MRQLWEPNAPPHPPQPTCNGTGQRRPSTGGQRAWHDRWPLCWRLLKSLKCVTPVLGRREDAQCAIRLAVVGGGLLNEVQMCRDVLRVALL